MSSTNNQIAPSFLKREQDKSQDLFIVSFTLSNKKNYNVKVKKNCNPARVADMFCYENGLPKDVIGELKDLIKKCMQEFPNGNDTEP